MAQASADQNRLRINRQLKREDTKGNLIVILPKKAKQTNKKKKTRYGLQIPSIIKEIGG